MHERFTFYTDAIYVVAPAAPVFLHDCLPSGRRFLNLQKTTASTTNTIVNAIPDSPATYLDKDDVSVVSGSNILSYLSI